jgi:nucleotide-binding universal stress UspA family protein
LREGAFILLIQQNNIAMKKILVPCDFSNPAIDAYRFALDVAAQAKGTVQLLHVIELPVLHDTLLMPTLSFEEELLRELKEKAEVEFERITSKYKVEGVSVTTNVLFGSTSKMILDFANDQAVDLIVMGSHGASGLREFFVGSNAEKIVRRSPVPVLVLKGYYKGPIKDIIFPNTLDTENQEDLVMKVKALQNFFKAHLHIVWINTPVNFTSDTVTFKRLNHFAKRFILKNYTVQVFNYDNEEEGIINFAKLIKGDLIAMGTHGRKGVSHLLNGSMAEDVVNHTKNLVWTYSLKNEPVEA